MLLKQFKNEKDEKQAKELWTSFEYKNGHKNIKVDNFLELGYVYCHYKIEKRYYSGYFTENEINLIFKILNYYNGKIMGLAG